MTGVAKGTVLKLLGDIGLACFKYQDKHLVNLTSKRIECDEIWSFCHAKEQTLTTEDKGKYGYGDVWTFVALDADTKLVVSWWAGKREPEDAYEFLRDVKRRLTNRVQLTTDGHHIYYYAVDGAFGDDIDYGMLVKFYKSSPYVPAGRYSPGSVRKVEVKRIIGNPDRDKISTSYVERQNLTMRMNMRRFTRLTNGFSKKIENLIFAVALHYMCYNFVRIHKTLGCTPAMAAGVADHVWSLEEIIGLLDSN